jgi:DNA adenine methylase
MSSRTGFHEISVDELFDRAQHPQSVRPRPFLRWAGSKKAVLRHVVPLLPAKFRTYYEPFLGSGALFFLLQPKHAVLSDTCIELIDTFAAVRENVSAVIRHLKPLKPRKHLYYRVRDNRSTGRYKRAAEFIFLNKACWNGLYRVNSSGVFNVPFGRPKTDFLADIENLQECALKLRVGGIKLRVCDFEETLAQAKKGDLVYLDPPYVTRHDNNGFIDWNESLFSWRDQQRLARVAEKLVRKGVYVVASNANHREILDLYPSFTATSFIRSSTLASNPSKRGRVAEVLLRSIH